MSQFTRFMKQNKSVRKNTMYAATGSLTDEKGEPLKWTIKPLTAKENEDIRDSCMTDIPDEKNPGAYKTKLDFTKYKAKVLCACVVEPCLNSDELLSSYGADEPEELIYEMVDDPGEYDRFFEFVSRYSGFISADEKIEKAKN